MWGSAAREIEVVGSQVKRQLDIEKLLHWAFRDELPKKGIEWASSSGISPMFRLADLGTRVDDWSREPGFPVAVGAPHPDSLLVEGAVERLADVDVDWPATRRGGMIGSLAGLLADNEPTLASLTIGRVGLVAMHARMGTRPRWDMNPLPEPVVGRNGKAVVQYLGDDGRLVDGRRNGNPGAGARCPLMWFPAPRAVAFARIEYSVWHASLLELAAALEDQLEFNRALPPAASSAPWRTFG